MNRRVISAILVVVLVCSCFSMSLFTTGAATEYTEPTIVVDSKYAAVGTTVDVDVRVVNNPGIAGATIGFTYDNGLTLLSAKNGEAFSDLTLTVPGKFTSPSNFLWDSESGQVNSDGTILTLTFEVNENAQINSNLNIEASYYTGDIYNEDMESVSLQLAAGCVTVIDYIPGDANGDGVVTGKDVTLIRRSIVGGYNLEINPLACDVNEDDRINGRDVTLLRRYIVGGYDVVPKPSKPKCEHTMTLTEYKAATCETDGNRAYWQCSKCNKYFDDVDGVTEITLENTVIKATGHNAITYDAIPATSTTEGYTAGVWCDKCETWTHGHEVIPPIDSNESNINYRHYVKKESSTGAIEIVNDNYLSTHEIVNPNPSTYEEGKGVPELIEGVAIDGKKVTANGYSFLGWYEKPELTAKRVYSISADTSGDKILYGIWSKDEYTITYLPDSATSILPRVEDDTYTIDKETSLKAPPSWPNMVWVGWSDEDGKIVKSIPRGTTGNISLTANWMSRRSQTVPNTKYADSIPAIVTDAENGIYTFTYEIGDIQNVPIQQLEEGTDGGKGFNLVKGQTHTISTTYTQKITEGEAVNVANTIANATTKSDSWTLSENWNKSSSFSQEHSSEVSQEQSQSAATSLSQSGKYSLSSGKGGSEEHIDEKGKSTKTTKKHEFGVSVNVGAKADLKGVVTAATPFKNASVEANLGLDYKYTNETAKETNEKHTDKTSTYWNTNEGFETSETLSQTHEFSQSLSQSIRDTYSYGETLDYGGASSKTASSSNTTSESREYSTCVDYSTEEGTSKTVSETFTADADTGWYRKVVVANFKVFAVVVYDMKSSTFSTMTYTLKISDSEHLFTDYSTVSSFNDYENGVLPFEVPTFVGDYVYGLVGASDGLRINEETGVVEGYGFKDPTTGICYKKYDENSNTYSEPCDTDVIIPRFIVVTVSSNEKRIVPVTGINSSVFSGTNITSVYLSDSIKTIPASAFENCTSLKYVRGGTITAIGDNAFRNCTSLFEFELSSNIDNLGQNAFEKVKALTVYANNSTVFDAALASGTKRLTVDIEYMKDSIDNKTVITPEGMEYFHLSGGGKTVNNLSIESDANSVEINNIVINNTAGVPLQLSSSNLELAFTTITASGLVMRLDSDKTVITLDGNNYLVSSTENATLSESLQFIEKEGSSASGKLSITGNALVYGSVTGGQKVTFDSDKHSFVYLTKEEYNNMLNARYIYFDANGGTVDTSNKQMMWNSEVGALPTPVREGFTFLGWFRDGGVQVTESTVFTDLDDVTVRAYWQSGWVSESEMPEDSEVVDEKWAYDLTSYTSSNQSSMSGWEKYNTTSAWGSYGAWSGWSKTKVTASESRQVETDTIKATYKTQYNYSRYTQNSKAPYGVHGPWKRNWGNDIYCQYYFEKGWTDSALSCYQTQRALNPNTGTYQTFNCYGVSNNSWYNQITRQVVKTAAYTQYRYRDRSLVYTYYYKKVDRLEATTDPTGQTDVSNVVRMVQYIAK